LIGTNMSHAAHRLQAALAAHGAVATPAENDRDFVWMAKAVHSWRMRPARTGMSGKDRPMAYL
jgi:hypothetical protein